MVNNTLIKKLIIAYSILWVILYGINFILGCLSVNIAHCFRNSFIPLFLLLSGFAGVVSSLIDIATIIHDADTTGIFRTLRGCLKIFLTLLQLALLGWHIAGVAYVIENLNEKGKGSDKRNCGNYFIYSCAYILVYWLCFPLQVVLVFLDKRRQRQEYADATAPLDNTGRRGSYVNF